MLLWAQVAFGWWHSQPKKKRSSQKKCSNVVTFTSLLSNSEIYLVEPRCRYLKKRTQIRCDNSYTRILHALNATSVISLNLLTVQSSILTFTWKQISCRWRWQEKNCRTTFDQICHRAGLENLIRSLNWDSAYFQTSCVATRSLCMRFLHSIVFLNHDFLNAAMQNNCKQTCISQWVFSYNSESKHSYYRIILSSNCTTC